MQGMSRYTAVHVLFIRLIKNISLKICKLKKIKHWDIPLVVGKDDEILNQQRNFEIIKEEIKLQFLLTFSELLLKKSHLFKNIRMEWESQI